MFMEGILEGRVEDWAGVVSVSLSRSSWQTLAH